MKSCTCFGSKHAWSAVFLGYETIFSDCLRSQILRNSTLGSRLKHWDFYRLSHLHPTDFPVDCHLHVNSLSTGFEGSSSLDDPLPTRNPCCNFVGQTYAVPRSSQISFFKMNMAYPRHLAKKWCFSAWLVELCYPNWLHKIKSTPHLAVTCQIGNQPQFIMCGKISLAISEVLHLYLLLLKPHQL